MQEQGRWTGIICPALCFTSAAACSGGNPASVAHTQGTAWMDRNPVSADHTRRWCGQTGISCLCVCTDRTRQGSSAWMSTLITGHTDKILSLNLVWGSKALLVVRGNALSTLPSNSYRGGFCLDSKMKIRQKKNNTGFLLYTAAFKIHFRTSINRLEVSLWFFF